MAQETLNIRPQPDQVMTDIAAYVTKKEIDSQEAYQTARLVLMDSLGCAMAALDFPACTKLLGPVVPGTIVPNGTHVPGTDYQLDPVLGAFNIGTLIRWLDFNDAFLAMEWGHPSDNLGGILAVADWLSRQALAQGELPILVKEVLTASIKAHEIQGGLSLENSLNRVGLDHGLYVELATASVVAFMLGCTEDEIVNVISNVFIDAGTLRTYRHAPNTGSRKSWAAGDATSRGVRLALMAFQGEMGYPSALTAPIWGFYDVIFHGQAFKFQRPFGSYVMENVLFKVAFPAEFHAQTAVEAGLQLHPMVRERLDEIDHVVIHTQESAKRIIDKVGPLYNPADRDHCIQYMTAIALIFGELTAGDYEDARAADPRIDALRSKMEVIEDPRYSRDYLDPAKRSIGNAVQVFFKDGTQTEKIEVEYPIGHRRRRQEAVPLLAEKFKNNLAHRLSPEQTGMILDLFRDPEQLENTPVNELIDLFTR